MLAKTQTLTPSTAVMNVDPEFKKWAESYANHDGGNLDAPVWFVGIEPGVGANERKSPRDEFIGPVFPMHFLDYEDPNSPVPPLPSERGFNLSLLKLFMAMMDEVSICDELLPEAVRRCAKVQRFCAKDGPVLKLNLFPFPFRSDANHWWNNGGYSDATGLAKKDDYKKWCTENRFSILQSILTPDKARLIICIGKGNADYFRSAFAPGQSEFAHSEEIEGRCLKWLRLENSATVVAVIPFLTGPNGLNSNQRLFRFGKRLQELKHRIYDSSAPECS